MEYEDMWKKLVAVIVRVIEENQEDEELVKYYLDVLEAMKIIEEE